MPSEERASHDNTPDPEEVVISRGPSGSPDGPVGWSLPGTRSPSRAFGENSKSGRVSMQDMDVKSKLLDTQIHQETRSSPTEEAVENRTNGVEISRQPPFDNNNLSPPSDAANLELPLSRDTTQEPQIDYTNDISAPSAAANLELPQSRSVTSEPQTDATNVMYAPLAAANLELPPSPAITKSSPVSLIDVTSALSAAANLELPPSSATTRTSPTYNINMIPAPSAAANLPLPPTPTFNSNNNNKTSPSGSGNISPPHSASDKGTPPDEADNTVFAAANLSLPPSPAINAISPIDAANTITATSAAANLDLPPSPSEANLELPPSPAINSTSDVQTPPVVARSFSAPSVAANLSLPPSPAINTVINEQTSPSEEDILSPPSAAANLELPPSPAVIRTDVNTRSALSAAAHVELPISPANDAIVDNQESPSSAKIVSPSSAAADLESPPTPVVTQTPPVLNPSAAANENDHTSPVGAVNFELPTSPASNAPSPVDVTNMLSAPSVAANLALPPSPAVNEASPSDSVSTTSVTSAAANLALPPSPAINETPVTTNEISAQSVAANLELPPSPAINTSSSSNADGLSAKTAAANLELPPSPAVNVTSQNQTESDATNENSAPSNELIKDMKTPSESKLTSPIRDDTKEQPHITDAPTEDQISTVEGSAIDKANEDKPNVARQKTKSPNEQASDKQNMNEREIPKFSRATSRQSSTNIFSDPDIEMEELTNLRMTVTPEQMKATIPNDAVTSKAQQSQDSDKAKEKETTRPNNETDIRDSHILEKEIKAAKIDEDKKKSVDADDKESGRRDPDKPRQDSEDRTRDKERRRRDRDKDRKRKSRRDPEKDPKNETTKINGTNDKDRADGPDGKRKENIDSQDTDEKKGLSKPDDKEAKRRRKRDSDKGRRLKDDNATVKDDTVEVINKRNKDDSKRKLKRDTLGGKQTKKTEEEDKDSEIDGISNKGSVSKHDSGTPSNHASTAKSSPNGTPTRSKAGNSDLLRKSILARLNTKEWKEQITYYSSSDDESVIDVPKTPPRSKWSAKSDVDHKVAPSEESKEKKEQKEEERREEKHGTKKTKSTREDDKKAKRKLKTSKKEPEQEAKDRSRHEDVSERKVRREREKRQRADALKQDVTETSQKQSSKAVEDLESKNIVVNEKNIKASVDQPPEATSSKRKEGRSKEESKDITKSKNRKSNKKSETNDDEPKQSKLENSQHPLDRDNKDRELSHKPKEEEKERGTKSKDRKLKTTSRTKNEQSEPIKSDTTSEERNKTEESSHNEGKTSEKVDIEDTKTDIALDSKYEDKKDDDLIKHETATEVGKSNTRPSTKASISSDVESKNSLKESVTNEPSTEEKQSSTAQDIEEEMVVSSTTPILKKGSAKKERITNETSAEIKPSSTTPEQRNDSTKSAEKNRSAEKENITKETFAEIKPGSTTPDKEQRKAITTPHEKKSSAKTKQREEESSQSSKESIKFENDTAAAEKHSNVSNENKVGRSLPRKSPEDDRILKSPQNTKPSDEVGDSASIKTDRGQDVGESTRKLKSPSEESLTSKKSDKKNDDDSNISPDLQSAQQSSTLRSDNLTDLQKRKQPPTEDRTDSKQESKTETQKSIETVPKLPTNVNGKTQDDSNTRPHSADSQVSKKKLEEPSILPTGYDRKSADKSTTKPQSADSKVSKKTRTTPKEIVLEGSADTELSNNENGKSSTKLRSADSAGSMTKSNTPAEEVIKERLSETAGQNDGDKISVSPSQSTQSKQSSKKAEISAAKKDWASKHFDEESNRKDTEKTALPPTSSSHEIQESKQETKTIIQSQSTKDIDVDNDDSKLTLSKPSVNKDQPSSIKKEKEVASKQTAKSSEKTIKPNAHEKESKGDYSDEQSEFIDDGTDDGEVVTLEILKQRAEEAAKGKSEENTKPVGQNLYNVTVQNTSEDHGINVVPSRVRSSAGRRPIASARPRRSAVASARPKRRGATSGQAQKRSFDDPSLFQYPLTYTPVDENKEESDLTHLRNAVSRLSTNPYRKPEDQRKSSIGNPRDFSDSDEDDPNSKEVFLTRLADDDDDSDQDENENNKNAPTFSRQIKEQESKTKVKSKSKLPWQETPPLMRNEFDLSDERYLQTKTKINQRKPVMPDERNSAPKLKQPMKSILKSNSAQYQINQRASDHDDVSSIEDNEDVYNLFTIPKKVDKKALFATKPFLQDEEGDEDSDYKDDPIFNQAAFSNSANMAKPNLVSPKQSRHKTRTKYNTKSSEDEVTRQNKSRNSIRKLDKGARKPQNQIQRRVSRIPVRQKPQVENIPISYNIPSPVQSDEEVKDFRRQRSSVSFSKKSEPPVRRRKENAWMEKSESRSYSRHRSRSRSKDRNYSMESSEDNRNVPREARDYSKQRTKSTIRIQSAKMSRASNKSRSKHRRSSSGSSEDYSDDPTRDYTKQRTKSTIRIRSASPSRYGSKSKDTKDKSSQDPQMQMLMTLLEAAKEHLGLTDKIDKLTMPHNDHNNNLTTNNNILVSGDEEPVDPKALTLLKRKSISTTNLKKSVTDDENVEDSVKKPGPRHLVQELRDKEDNEEGARMPSTKSVKVMDRRSVTPVNSTKRNISPVSFRETPPGTTSSSNLRVGSSPPYSPRTPELEGETISMEYLKDHIRNVLPSLGRKDLYHVTDKLIGMGVETVEDFEYIDKEDLEKTRLNPIQARKLLTTWKPHTANGRRSLAGSAVELPTDTDHLPAEELVDKNRWLKFNVGGIMLETTRDSVDRLQSPFLALLLDPDSDDVEPPPDGIYRIDRNPEAFQILLDYARYGKIVGNPEVLGEDFLLGEIEYYKMDRSVIKCVTDYFDEMKKAPNAGGIEVEKISITEMSMNKQYKHHNSYGITNTTSIACYTSVPGGKGICQTDVQSLFLYETAYLRFPALFRAPCLKCGHIVCFADDPLIGTEGWCHKCHLCLRCQDILCEGLSDDDDPRGRQAIQENLVRKTAKVTFMHNPGDGGAHRDPYDFKSPRGEQLNLVPYQGGREVKPSSGKALKFKLPKIPDAMDVPKHSVRANMYRKSNSEHPMSRSFSDFGKW